MLRKKIRRGHHVLKLARLPPRTKLPTGLGLAMLLERNFSAQKKGRIACHSGAAPMLANSATPRTDIGAHA